MLMSFTEIRIHRENVDLDLDLADAIITLVKMQADSKGKSKIRVQNRIFEVEWEGQQNGGMLITVRLPAKS